MYTQIFLDIFLFILTTVEGQKGKGSSIAVVEYHPVHSPALTPAETLETNANHYIKILDELSQDYKLIAIVFPEATLDDVRTSDDLSSYGVKITRYEDPCLIHQDSYPRFLHKLSCAAITYRTRIVVNIIESFENKFYSSDIVLNRQGVIEMSIARENRVGVPHLHNYPVPFVFPAIRYFRYGDKESKIDTYSFTPTSFITGFSFSAEKAISLNESRHYLISSNWISQLPFLTSFQVYQMWAQEYKLTLFFSSANNPERGQGGTGVYHASGGPLVMDILATGGTKSYVYTFSNDEKPGTVTNPPRKSTDELALEMDKFYIEADPDMHRYESKVLNLSMASGSTDTLCYNKSRRNNFCCEFIIQTSFDSTFANAQQYVYHMVAYKGYKTYYNIFQPGGVEICAIIACVNSSISSCGRRFENYEVLGWPITFEKIVIKAKFSWPLKENIYLNSQFPNSLLSSIRPIHPNFTRWTKQIITDDEKRTYIERTFTLLRRQSRILTFGIFGRNFSLVDSAETDRFYHYPIVLCSFIFTVLLY